MLNSKVVAEILGTTEHKVVWVAKDLGLNKRDGKWLFNSDQIDQIKDKIAKLKSLIRRFG